MSGQNHPSLRQIAQDITTGRFRRDFYSQWSIALLYRMPSLPLVWVFLRAGLSPMQVSLLALLIALSLPVQAVGLPMAAAPALVCLSAMLFQVLDCADGTMARLTGRSSRSGGDLDFLIDMAQWGMLYIAIGLLADRLDGGGFGWTALAATAAWARLLARVVRDRLADPDAPDDGAARPPSGIIDTVVFLLAGISGLIPFFALFGPWIGWAVLFLLIYGVLDVIEGGVPLITRLRQ